MSELRIIKENAVSDLLSAVLSRVHCLIAPVERGDGAVFERIDSADRIAPARVRCDNSVKEFFFPRWRALFAYEWDGRKPRITEPSEEAAPFVVFGAHPCDAASLEILDRVFLGEKPDEAWRLRRAGATIVAAGCAAADRYCFCTSVGLAPDSKAGADVFLTPTPDEEYIASAVTPKGAAFMEEYSPFFRTVTHARPAVAEVPRRLRCENGPSLPAAAFESPQWESAAQRCLGCAICTYYCPTCHCFNIEDESDGESGARLLGWDSCSFPLFTKHASGHNPRPSGAARRRQRVMHKFAWYPELFGAVSCTGCGRCGRLCPVDLGIEETLRMLEGSL